MSTAPHRNGTPAAPADLVPLVPDAGPPADHRGASIPPTVAQQLEAPLDPSLVAQRQGRAGHTFPYLPGWVAIAQANRLLGYGGWGYDLVGAVTPRELTTRDAETGAVEHTTAYTATVRLHVPGMPPRTDVGFRVVAEESAQGHETAYKGAVTDALKRALCTLGAQFGTTSPVTGAPVPPTPGPRRCARRCWRWVPSRASPPRRSARPCANGWARTWTRCPPPSCSHSSQLPPAS